MQLSIIIVNYNVKYFLEQCLCSVVKACRNIRAEIIVIDNHSTDGSEAYFSQRFQQVRFIWKTSNDGFAKANNEALQIATGQYMLFLNPDTIVAEDCFELCLSQMEANRQIGALGVHMIDGSGQYLPESKRGFPTLFTSLCKMSGLTALFPTSTLFARYYMGHLPANANATVDVLAGAFMLVQKKVLDEVGSFDPAFFMYAEDIDLSYRIQKAGYINFYFTGTSIIHFKGESTTKADRQYIRTFYGAMRLFVQKHYGPVRSRLYQWMIDAAITMKIAASAFRKTAVTTAAFRPAGSATLVADVVTSQQLQPLLRQQFTNLSTTQSIDPLPSTGHALLLSETAVTYQSIIALMQLHPGRYQYYIHGSGTGAMVGSDDKNTVGSVIRLQHD